MYDSVCVTSVLRITTLDVATSHLDTPWTNIPSSMWTVIEMNLGIICACLPTFRQMLSVLFPRLFDGLRRTVYGADTSTNGSRARGRKKDHISGPSLSEEASNYAAGWTKMPNSSLQYVGKPRAPNRAQTPKDGTDVSSLIRMTTHGSEQYTRSDISGSRGVNIELDPTESRPRSVVNE